LQIAWNTVYGDATEYVVVINDNVFLNVSRISDYSMFLNPYLGNATHL
jgi:hypothetical protein